MRRHGYVGRVRIHLLPFFGLAYLFERCGVPPAPLFFEQASKNRYSTGAIRVFDLAYFGQKASEGAVSPFKVLDTLRQHSAAVNEVPHSTCLVCLFAVMSFVPGSSSCTGSTSRRSCYKMLLYATTWYILQYDVIHICNICCVWQLVSHKIGNSNLVYSCSQDCTIRQWDAKTRVHIHKFEGHSNWVRALCFSTHAAYMCSASEDQSVIVWDLSAQQKVRAGRLALRRIPWRWRWGCFATTCR